MSHRVSGTLSFSTQDDLVVAYSARLCKGEARLQTKTALQSGEAVAIRIHLKDSGASLNMDAISASSRKNESGGYTTRIRFTEKSQRALQEFIVQSDPSRVTVRPEPSARRLSVAVIDDDAMQRETAARPFLDRGDQVLTAHDGLAGLALCVEHEPDIVLSDVQMPKVDGWQMLRMLRARPRLKKTPVIFLSTLSGDESRLRGYRLGVDDYLAKPYSAEVLVLKVDRLVRRARVGVHSLVPRAPAEPNALRGDLEHVSLPSLLAFVELEAMTGVLHLEPRGCHILIDQGRPVYAKSGERDSTSSGVKALFDLLGLESGGFEFVPGPCKASDSIRMSVSAVLLEHARIADEARAS